MKKSNMNSTNKSTPTQVQSFNFVANLRQELDKMAQNCKKNEMVKAAHEYIKTGMSKSETEELLQLDGFEPIMVRAFMKSADFTEEVNDDASQRWGFDIEDVHGRIFSSSDDFGIVVRAASEQEAREMAEEEILKHSTTELDRVTNVYMV